ncbi:hypothetical protein ACTD5D_20845 [Nocardia takedensis]|uniref:hypothetical protein n=1 Tax=Nocardia takedensis TaxID=259390 RepID=UPI003F76B61F
MIGVSEHTNPELPPIPAAANNLTDLRRFLTDPAAGTFAAEHCTLLHQPNRSDQIGEAVGRAARAATDVLLVYYTGHGLLDRQGRLHLAMADSDPDRVTWTTMPFSTCVRRFWKAPPVPES